MIFIKVNNEKYEASISGLMKDAKWDDRESKSITLSMSNDEVKNLHPDNTKWSIVQEEGNDVQEWDNSEYCLSGDITDHRDGTVTIKMGKLTDLEIAYEMVIGG